MTAPVQSPAAELYERLVDLLGAHDVHPEDRIAIRHAYEEAGGEDASWDDLPAEIQALIVENEKLPRQSWDDPMDVPDNLEEL